MKRMISKWRDNNGVVNEFIGDGDTVKECKQAILEQMDDIESDENLDICFLECLSATVTEI